VRHIGGEKNRSAVGSEGWTLVRVTFLSVRIETCELGKLQAPKARSCDCRRQETPHG